MPILEAEGIELYHLQVSTSGNHSVLRVYIDKPGGVNVDDCSRVSRQLSLLMDAEDPIRGSYMFEVSSPGINRPLATPEHFLANIGQRVKVKTRKPVGNKQRNFVGILKEFDAEKGNLFLEEESGDVVLEFENIVKANIDFPFEIPKRK